MILSSQTKEILRSFTSINKSMLLEWNDGCISVFADARNILATAEVPERFPKAWGVYDVPQLLSVIEAIDCPEAEYVDNGNAAVFKSPVGTLEYRFTLPSLITSPPAKSIDVKNKQPLAEFDLDKVTIQKLTKAAYTLLSTHVEVSCRGDGVFLKACKLNDNSAHTFTVKATNPTYYEEGIANFALDLLVMIPDDYHCIVNNRVWQFVSKNKPVQYWIVAS